ncbi:MAG TPA: hypothetical protein VK335_09895 [Bryobacteraceae bacterium]|nr:hypothetical protein [Bryobacteraceae bacterium]
MRFTSLLVPLWMVGAAFAQDPQLHALDATLVTLHAHAAEATIETSGARPELTVAKHQLRDWVEAQLSSLKELGHEDALANQINKAREAAGVASVRPFFLALTLPAPLPPDARTTGQAPPRA